MANCVVRVVLDVAPAVFRAHMDGVTRNIFMAESASGYKTSFGGGGILGRYFHTALDVRVLSQRMHLLLSWFG